VISGNVISGEYSCTDPLGDDKGVWTADKEVDPRVETMKTDL